MDNDDFEDYLGWYLTDEKIRKDKDAKATAELKSRQLNAKIDRLAQNVTEVETCKDGDCGNWNCEPNDGTIQGTILGSMLAAGLPDPRTLKTKKGKKSCKRNMSNDMKTPQNPKPIESQKDKEWKKKHGAVPLLSEDGKTITYGLYPQTVVSDAATIDALDKLTTTEPNGWYLYNDEYYVKLKADIYDPPNCFSKSEPKFKNGTAIISGKIYWFKCEPIVWKILRKRNGRYLVLSSYVLDGHCYDDDFNNYEDSKIRAWLNNEFYNSAFAFCDKDKYIQTTTIDNSAYPTDNSSNKYAYDAKDKIFLLSFEDYLNTKYGFSSYNRPDESRECKTTDYAGVEIDGVGYGTFGYWTRSPRSSSSNLAWLVGGDGGLYPFGMVDSDGYYDDSKDRFIYFWKRINVGGVRPSLTIKTAYSIAEYDNSNLVYCIRCGTIYEKSKKACPFCLCEDRLGGIPSFEEENRFRGIKNEIFSKTENALEQKISELNQLQERKENIKRTTKILAFVFLFFAASSIPIYFFSSVDFAWLSPLILSAIGFILLFFIKWHIITDLESQITTSETDVDKAKQRLDDMAKLK